MYFDYGSTRAFNTVYSFIDSSGDERILASGTDGYVYELDIGTSLDGDNIMIISNAAIQSFQDL